MSASDSPPSMSILRGEENTHCRTVEIHERLKRPVLGVVAVGVIVRPAERKGREIRPLRQF